MRAVENGIMNRGSECSTKECDLTGMHQVSATFLLLPGFDISCTASRRSPGFLGGSGIWTD